VPKVPAGACRLHARRQSSIGAPAKEDRPRRIKLKQQQDGGHGSGRPAASSALPLSKLFRREPEEEGRASLDQQSSRRLSGSPGAAGVGGRRCHARLHPRRRGGRGRAHLAAAAAAAAAVSVRAGWSGGDRRHPVPRRWARARPRLVNRSRRRGTPGCAAVRRQEVWGSHPSYQRTLLQ
jgi:hypothetical protein